MRSSKFASVKTNAIAMRKRGASLRDVALHFGIQKSTLSYWFQNVELSDLHKARLQKRHEKALVTARIEAVKWHNAQKAARMREAEASAAKVTAKIDHTNDTVLELALAILYLGEGMKKSGITSLGNSDPHILRFFVESLRRLYAVPLEEMRCELHIRADQNPAKLIRHWSATLGIPSRNFGKTSIDKRTQGRPTYPGYKGVCIVRCGRVAIQRKLVYIANTFCDTIANGDARG